MPVYGITANVGGGGNYGVTLIARAADGTMLDSAASPPPILDPVRIAARRKRHAIAHLECWPNQTNATVRIDNLDLVLQPAIADFDRDGDVDQSDFGHFQACLTGADAAQNDPACRNALLDNDSDVDQADFGLFQRCYSGTASSRPRLRRIVRSPAARFSAEEGGRLSAAVPSASVCVDP